MPLTSVIAVHSRDMLIDKKIWGRFCENVRKLKEEGRVNDKDISTLFYGHHIEEVLKSYRDSQTDEITSDFILTEIQSVGKLVDDATAKKLEEQKEVFEKQLTQKELDKEKEIERNLTKIKEKVKARAVRAAKTWAIALTYAPVALVVLIFLCLVAAKGWETTSYIFVAIASVLIIFSFLGLKVDVLNLRERIQDRLFQAIYKKQVTELALDEHLRS